MDLPDFIKESVSQIQILCTFQARGAPGEKPTHSKAQRARTHKKSPDAAQ
ncbi:hypothetical protein HMPREF1492_1171 [Atopobium sp. BS2]|nr:hypothetical protein HMPREF1492_1171 [Atopobium sp. BS2]